VQLYFLQVFADLCVKSGEKKSDGEKSEEKEGVFGI
jgi:hypothetical protein